MPFEGLIIVQGYCILLGFQQNLSTDLVSRVFTACHMNVRVENYPSRLRWNVWCLLDRFITQVWYYEKAEEETRKKLTDYVQEDMNKCDLKLEAIEGKHKWRNKIKK